MLLCEVLHSMINHYKSTQLTNIFFFYNCLKSLNSKMFCFLLRFNQMFFVLTCPNSILNLVELFFYRTGQKFSTFHTIGNQKWAETNITQVYLLKVLLNILKLIGFFSYLLLDLKGKGVINTMSIKSNVSKFLLNSD